MQAMKWSADHYCGTVQTLVIE